MEIVSKRMLIEGKPELGNDDAPVRPRNSLATLGLFLLGNGTAIRRLAATPHLWVVGLLLTISAGLAREYDAEYLFAEPWHLLIAPGASLIAATVLWLFVQLSGVGHWQWSKPGPYHADTQAVNTDNANVINTPTLFRQYLIFLALFWMTSPLAWLYGIPYEQFSAAGAAAKSNLWTLALIALWRVVLMARILFVFYGMRIFSALTIVLLFGDVLMLVALAYIPVPIFAIMGGVRLGPADQMLASAAFFGQILGTLALFVLVPAWYLSYAFRGPKWGTSVSAPGVCLKPLIVLAILMIMFWSAWLPVTQPPQKLRHHIEKLLVAGDLENGLALLEKHYPNDLPPHWDPPPRSGWRNKKPNPLIVLTYILDHPKKEVVQQLYEQKLTSNGFRHSQFSKKEFDDLLTYLERSPAADRIINKSGTSHILPLRNILEYNVERSGYDDFKTRIKTLLNRYPEDGVLDEQSREQNTN